MAISRCSMPRSACPHAQQSHARAGFTLLELMIVTAILSILAMVIAAPMMRAREKAMVGAARAEATQLIKAAEMYEAINNSYPSTFEQLETIDYTASDDLEFCRFELTGGNELRVDLRHRGTDRGVSVNLTSVTNAVTEVDLATCTEVRVKSNKGKSDKTDKGQGQSDDKGKK